MGNLQRLLSHTLAITQIFSFRWRFAHWTPERIRRWQDHRVRKLVRWAAAHLPYYRDLWQGHDLNEVWTLPTTCKRDMMANMAGSNALGATWDELTHFREEVDSTQDYGRLFRGRYNVELSSGTSGAKGIYILSPRERALYGTMIAARNGIPHKLKPVRAVLIMRADSSAFQEINRPGINLKYLSLATPIPEMVRWLNKVSPNVLAGQPWVLKELARQQQAGRLNLRLGTLIPIAEVLHPDIKEVISESFAAPIRELYQASEGIIAASCEQGRMHINEDFVAVQLYDDAWKPARNEKPALRMVVTDLYRRAQPIIRYELNDMIEIDSEPCPCGSSFRVIRRIHGRSDDLLWARNQTGELSPIFPDYFLRSIIRGTEDVDEYQVIQPDPDSLRVRLQLRGKTDPQVTEKAVRKRLSQIYADHGCLPPKVEFVFGPPLLHPDSKKLRRVIRTFDPPSFDIPSND